MAHEPEPLTPQAPAHVALPAPLRTALLAVTLAILAIVLIRCSCAQSLNPYWDLDPRLNVDEHGAALPTCSLGPTEVAWLNVGSVALAAVALALHVAAGGRVRWLSLGLAAAGAVACIWHMSEHIDSLTHGADWIAAVALGLAALHLGAHPALRRWMAAALMALVVPLAVQALVYVLHDYPQTLAHFRAHETEMANARGAPLDSVEHRLFAHRLDDWAASGAFSLSNVFGSVVLAFMCFPLAAAAWLWTRGRRAAAGRMAVLVVAGLTGIVLSRSRGAGLTLIGVVALLAALWRARLIRARQGADARVVPRSRVWWLPLALPGLMVLLVLGIGCLGPLRLGHAGLSMYFRFQYLAASAKMFLAQPLARVLSGVGAGRFQDAFACYKGATCPEDVISAHNVFADQLTILGLCGAAWSVMLVLWYWTRVRGEPDVAIEWTATSGAGPPTATSNAPATPPGRGSLLGASLLSAAVFGTQAVVLKDVLPLPETLLPLLVGFLAFLGILGALAESDWLDSTALDLGLLLAAAALLIHGQIEMTFFQPGSSAAAMLIMGMAGSRVCSSGHSTQDRARQMEQRWGALLAAALILAMAGWLATTYAMPMGRQQAALATGAQRLQAGDREGASASLQRACAALPTDPRIYRWRVRLLLEPVDEIVRAWGQDWARNETQRQVVQEDLARATAVTDEAFRAGLFDMMVEQLRARIDLRSYYLLHDRAALSGAYRRWRKKIIPETPHNPRSFLEVALIELELDDVEKAKADFAKAVAIGKQLSLDPEMPLTNAEIRQFQAALQRHSGAH